MGNGGIVHADSVIDLVRLEEELDSLGVRIWRRNEFNDVGELENLTKGIKHAMLQAYRNACGSSEES